MDAPVRQLSELTEDGDVLPIPAAKVYAVQVVLCEGEGLHRYTVVLDKSGARRIEAVGGASAPVAVATAAPVAVTLPARPPADPQRVPARPPSTTRSSAPRTPHGAPVG